MINLSFHWSWLLIAAVLIIGVIIASPFLNSGNDGPAGGIGPAFGCFIIIVAFLAVAVIGGIYIW